MSRYVIYGAGGIGCVLGARLARANCDVTLIARGEHARVMAQQGVRVIDWQNAETHRLPVVDHPQHAAIDANTMVLMCMKSQQTESALIDLSRCADPLTTVVCVQNGVANERVALRYFERVIATVVNLPVSFLKPGEVVTYAKGREGILDSGLYPEGVDATVQALCEDLERAGFRALADASVMRKKYAKLLLNLGNSVQATLAEPGGEMARNLIRHARNEALACFEQAGIDCAPRDEIADANESVFQTVDVPGYPRTAGSSWQSLARGTGDIETEYLNGEIAYLGRRHGIATPANTLLVHLAREVIIRGGDPQSIGVAQVQDMQNRLRSNLA